MQFSPGERLAIRNVWRTTAEDFSPFAINVTTVEPASFGDGVNPGTIRSDDYVFASVSITAIR